MHYLLSRIKKACQVAGCHLNLTTEKRGKRTEGEKDGERNEERELAAVSLKKTS